MLPVADFKCRGPYSRDFCTKSPGLGKKWHPGALGHKLRGDAMAYALLATLRDSVHYIATAAEKDQVPIDAPSVFLSPGNDVGRLWFRSNRLLREEGVVVDWEHPDSPDRVRVSELDPVACAQEECRVPPQCFTGKYIAYIMGVLYYRCDNVHFLYRMCIQYLT